MMSSTGQQEVSQRKPTLPASSSGISGLQNSEDIYFCCFSAPECGSLSQYPNRPIRSLTVTPKTSIFYCALHFSAEQLSLLTTE